MSIMEIFMYKNKAENGGNYICGKRIKEIRENLSGKILSGSWQICCKWLDWILIRMWCSGLKMGNGL